MKKNKFSKALKHIKKDLNEVAPTNSMSGVYSRGPVGQRLGVKNSARTFYPDQDGNWPSGIPGTAGDPTYTRPAGYWDGGPGSVDTVEYANTYTTDWSHPDASNPRDTSGLIAEDGTVKSLLPPGSRSFILGPLVDGYTFNHGSDDFTRIGYIQKDTRQFVLLAKIDGHWNNTDPVYNGNPTSRVWDGTETGFTTYNENFTLAMAQWFRNRMLNGKGITRNVSYFSSGGIGQLGNPDPDAPDGSLGGNGPGGSGHGGSGAGAGGGNPDIGTPQGDPENDGWDPNDPVPVAGVGGVTGLLAALAAFLGMSINAAREWWNNATPEERQKIKDLLFPPDVATVPSGPNTPLPAPGWGRKGNFTPAPMWQKPLPGGGTGTWGTTIKLAHHELEGQVISESRRRQLREIKKPYVIQEQPVQKLRKYRPNFKGRFSPQNTPNVTASKQTDDAVKAKNSQGQAWSIGDKYWSGYETTERMNVIYDRLGHGNMAWDRILDEARQKNGWKNREIQEQLNIIAAEKAERQMCSDYESPWGTVIHEQGASTEKELDTVMKDPLVKKVAKRLRQEIDYKDKPARKGYPDKPPAKQVDGWHPEYGKKYKYDKLDPVSAITMRNAPTGDPEIDANVKKASMKSKVKVKENLSSWRTDLSA